MITASLSSLMTTASHGQGASILNNKLIMDLVSNCSKTDDNYQNYIDNATSFVKQHGRLFKWILSTFLTLCISTFVIYSLAYDFHENVVVLILALLLCSGLATYGIYCKFGGQLRSLYRSKVKQLTDRNVRILYWYVDRVYQYLCNDCLNLEYLEFSILHNIIVKKVSLLLKTAKIRC